MIYIIRERERERERERRESYWFGFERVTIIASYAKE
jgi:hypothetical protein